MSAHLSIPVSIPQYYERIVFHICYSRVEFHCHEKKIPYVLLKKVHSARGNVFSNLKDKRNSTNVTREKQYNDVVTGACTGNCR